MLVQSKDDRKRVEQALTSSHLQSGKVILLTFAFGIVRTFCIEEITIRIRIAVVQRRLIISVYINTSPDSPVSPASPAPDKCI